MALDGIARNINGEIKAIQDQIAHQQAILNDLQVRLAQKQSDLNDVTSFVTSTTGKPPILNSGPVV